MESQDRKRHWEHVYHTKELKDVSWYQPTPTTSLDFVRHFNVPKDARIIDIGGGDSLLVDHLLDQGYEDITVLDISEAALDRARQRLGDRAAKIKWIAADATAFEPAGRYDFWHDRATFHFLSDEQEIERYVETAQRGLNPEGVLVVGTFSENGPRKCSGIEVRQYSEASMAEQFKRFFDKIKCVAVDHKTPFDTTQNFVFCSFRKKQC